MRYPMDLVELYYHAMIFQKTMQVIQIVTSEVKWILLHFLCFGICMLKTLDLI